MKRFEAAGVHEKLHDHEQTQQEELLLERASLSLRSAMAPKAGLTLDTDYLALAGGTPEPPRAQLITRARSILDHYNAAVATALTALNSARAAAEANLVVLRSEWDEETKEIRESLEKVLRELQPDGIDGGEYLRLRSELSDLEPLTQERARRAAYLQALISDRESLLVAAEDRRAQRLRALQQEAKKVARGLPNIVRASVRDGEDRKVLTDLLDSHVGGRVDRIRTAINQAESLSPRAFAQSCRKGSDAIAAAFPSVTTAQALQLANARSEVLLLMEEIEFPISTDLQLNVSSKDSPTWRSLDNLSTGQKATALLLLLMHRGDSPLVIDQPEDDLDNRFIYEDIVPRLRATKGKRQVIVSTHNANIPVLGDADQIVSLAAEDDGGGVAGRIIEDGLGSIDHPPVRAMVEELLEGGREAFNTRRYLYGF